MAHLSRPYCVMEEASLPLQASIRAAPCQGLLETPSSRRNFLPASHALAVYAAVVTVGLRSWKREGGMTAVYTVTTRCRAQIVDVSAWRELEVLRVLFRSEALGPRVRSQLFIPSPHASRLDHYPCPSPPSPSPSPSPGPSPLLPPRKTRGLPPISPQPNLDTRLPASSDRFIDSKHIPPHDRRRRRPDTYTSASASPALDPILNARECQEGSRCL
ncbi:hypothetical protein R3P38DRAFT_502619 [Favolaschia claudopus]|uniref:Uncharacterized protein n=1 Tax=Favolaschia claudopus TaxID=2862362 RepID=A0AAV9ZCV5_9AGAR